MRLRCVLGMQTSPETGPKQTKRCLDETDANTQNHTKRQRGPTDRTGMWNSLLAACARTLKTDLEIHSKLYFWCGRVYVDPNPNPARMFFGSDETRSMMVVYETTLVGVKGGRSLFCTERAIGIEEVEAFFKSLQCYYREEKSRISYNIADHWNGDQWQVVHQRIFRNHRLRMIMELADICMQQATLPPAIDMEAYQRGVECVGGLGADFEEHCKIGTLDEAIEGGFWN